MKLEFSRHILEIIQMSRVIKTRPVAGELFHADRQTDRQTRMKKLIVAFRNFASVPEKTILFAYSVREICPYHTCVAFAHLLL